MLATLVLVPLALVLLVSAVAVVTAPNLVRSVFWLATTLLATAGIYLTLGAPFLAAIQVLLYTGGVITMMLFGVMLTQRTASVVVPSPSEHGAGPALVAVVLAATALLAIWTTHKLAGLAVGASGTAQDVGKLFLDRYLLAFEALSVLLLAGMIGAIVLARRTDA